MRAGGGEASKITKTAELSKKSKPTPVEKAEPEGIGKPMIALEILLPNSEIVQFDIDETCTIKKLREFIEEQESISTEMYNLKLLGRTLVSNSTLCSAESLL